MEAKGSRPLSPVQGCPNREAAHQRTHDNGRARTRAPHLTHEKHHPGNGGHRSEPPRSYPLPPAHMSPHPPAARPRTGRASARRALIVVESGRGAKTRAMNSTALGLRTPVRALIAGNSVTQHFVPFFHHSTGCLLPECFRNPSDFAVSLTSSLRCLISSASHATDPRISNAAAPDFKADARRQLIACDPADNEPISIASIHTAMPTIIRFSVRETKPRGTLDDPPTQAHLSSRRSI